MIYFYIVLVSVASGILGGMGMGGGTILIPALVLLFDFPQHFSQAVNLAAFVVIGIFSLFVHTKNKMINYKVGLICGLLAGASAVGFAFLSKSLDGKVLRFSLGVFLIIIGIIELVKIIVKKINKKGDKKKNIC